MPVLTVLTTSPPRRRRLVRALRRAGFAVEQHHGVLALRDGVRVVLDDPAPDLAAVTDPMVEAATRLLGRVPRWAVRCESPTTGAEARRVLEAAVQALARCVPLAVLDDGSGTAFLVHPGRGLVGPEDYLATPLEPRPRQLLRALLDPPR